MGAPSIMRIARELYGVVLYKPTRCISVARHPPRFPSAKREEYGAARLGQPVAHFAVLFEGRGVVRTCALPAFETQDRRTLVVNHTLAKNTGSGRRRRSGASECGTGLKSEQRGAKPVHGLLRREKQQTNRTSPPSSNQPANRCRTSQHLWPHARAPPVFLRMF